ncbi:hypothetical protein GMD78_20390 [Ornithinibacillus sp. L9]|uniref:Heme A synthase n=1 Tax=Ornithinibacillus caprae TaxID=2678566 RepID=A0A6N8FS11_9BACI|nr:COX15/CtaA family protein [Ornithinibacillus caprae]MUK90718.1 hypothetical protein [Ornithinibacillus caprae]
MGTTKLAFLTIVLTYFLIVFGGYVASSESGMGCGPDWPLCNGEIIPDLKGDTLIEFGHRLIGAFLLALTLVLYVKMEKNYKKPAIKRLALVMLGLLGLQLVMGAIVVFYHLPSVVITIHLLIAMVFLAILIIFWRLDYPIKLKSTRIKNHLTYLILLILVTIGLGAYVKHQHYGLACGWFSCTQTFIPKTVPQIFQTIHRFLAAVSAVYFLYITYMIYKIDLSNLKIRFLLALFVMFAQLIIGIITIQSSISISYAVLHLAGATLIFALIVEARTILR